MKDLKGLKVCFIAGTLGMGGAERQLFYILRTLSELGAEVHLISFYSGEHWEKEIKTLNIKYYSLQGKGNTIARIINIIRTLRKIKPHIVQSQHFYTNLYAAWSSHFCGAVSVGSSRSALHAEIKQTGFWGRACFRSPDYLIANSMPSVEDAKDMGRKTDTIFYLPNALDTEKYSRGETAENKKSKTFIGIGRMIPLKRFELFIKLIKELSLKYPSRIRGILVGDGKELDTLKKLSFEMGLTEELMQFTGAVPDPEKYLLEADLLVLTSEYEGSPNVVIEAMASGKPVLCTKVGNLPYMVEDGINGVFFEHNGSNLFQKAEFFITETDEAIRMGQKGRETVAQSFSIESLKIRLLEIYTEIKAQKSLTFGSAV
jgi:glycosyltransferase involved in cell wall biosynthesis